MLRWLLVAGLLLNGLCCGAGLAADDASDSAGAYRGKKILWIDSYHAGYEWSDGIEQGIRDALQGSGVDLKIVHMDTKRNRGENFFRQAGLRANKIIEEYAPDVVIASDDNSQRYLVVPYLKNTLQPVVFCGVNRDPAEYGYPCPNVTGMREVDYAKDLFEKMLAFAGGSRIGLLCGDTETDKIVADSYNRKLYQGRLKVYQVRTFDEFKRAFLRAQQEVNLVHLRNNAGIQGWDDAAAEVFFTEHTRLPTGSINPWMKKFVIFNLAKQPQEHGDYAAATALRILAGTRPEAIPIVSSREGHFVVNLKMAKAAGIVLPVSLLQTAEVIGQDALEQ